MKKKTLKTLLLATALCAVTSVGAGVVSVNANADTALLSSDTFKTLGASIRLKTDELDTTGDGIRFAIGLEDSVYQSMLTDGELDNINVMVMPTQLIQSTGSQSVSDVFKIGYTYEKDLNNNGTIEENEKAKPIDKAIVSNWTADTTVEAGKTYWIAYAYVYGIPGGSYDCDLTVRAYYLADGADAANAIYTDVTDKSTRSFAYVANAAINDVKDSQTEIYANEITATGEYSPYSESTRKALRGYTNYAVAKGNTDTVRITESGVNVLTDSETWVLDKKTQLPASQKYTIEQKITVATSYSHPSCAQGFMFGVNYNEETGVFDGEYYYAYIRHNAAGIAALSGANNAWEWGGVSGTFSGEVSLKVVRNVNAMRLYVNDTLVKELVDNSPTTANGLHVVYRTQAANNPIGSFVTISEEPQYKLYTKDNQTPTNDTSLVTITKDTLEVNSTETVWALDRYAILPSSDKYTINTTVYNIDSRGNLGTLAGVAFGMTENGGDCYYFAICDAGAQLTGFWGANNGWARVATSFSNALLSGNVEISIVRDGNLIRAYANNVCVLSFVDPRTVTPTGTCVAFRSQAATSKYDTFTVSGATQMPNTIKTWTNNTSNTVVATQREDGSTTVTATVAGAETHVMDRTLVLPNSDKYTIEATFTMQANNAYQGFVFGSTTEMSNDYYYAYVRSGAFGIANTGDSNWWGATGWGDASASELRSGIAVGETYTFKVVRDGNTISLYINNYLAKTVTVSTSRTGLFVGFRMQATTSATYGKVTITDNSVS